MAIPCQVKLVGFFYCGNTRQKGVLLVEELHSQEVKDSELFNSVQLF